MSWHPIAAIAALATGLTGATAPTPPPPTDSNVEILDTERERYQRMTVPVTIQGQGPFDFLIDTGAQATVLSHDLVALLEVFDRQPAILVGMASRVATESVGVEGLMLGSRSFYIRTAPLVDAAHLGEADGILGLDSLQGQRVVLDFKEHTIAVANAETKGRNRGYDIIVKARARLGQLIITHALLDGVETTVIVDTGAQSSIGNPALLDRLRRTRLLGETKLTDVNGQQLSGMVRVARELIVERVHISNFPILFADAPPFHALGLADEPALILGMSELRLFRRVAIDFEKRQVLFDLPRGSRGFDSFYGRRIGV